MLKSRITLLLVAILLPLTSTSRYFNTARIAAGHESCELYAILGGSEIGLRNWHEAAHALISAFNFDSIKIREWVGERGTARVTTRGGKNGFTIYTIYIHGMFCDGSNNVC